MRAFVCEIDSSGLRRFIPEDLTPSDELRHLAMGVPRCSAWLFWTLLTDVDAEDLRADVDAGRHAEACGLLLNRAVDFISLGATAAFGTRRSR